MPDPASQPTPATPDELAAIYLRARDVPCPNCNYNRRDGTAAACPECTHAFQVSDLLPAAGSHFRRNLRRLCLLILITQIIAVGSAIFTFVSILRIAIEVNAVPLSYAHSLTRTSVHIVFGTAAIVFAWRAGRAMRIEQPITRPALRYFMLAVLFLTVKPMLSPVLFALFNFVL